MLKTEKYEIKCTRADADKILLEISIGSEKLSDEEVASFMNTLRSILCAFGRAESVSSRFGSVNGQKKK